MVTRLRLICQDLDLVQDLVALADHVILAADVQQRRLFGVLDDEAFVADRLEDLFGDGFLQDGGLGRRRGLRFSRLGAAGGGHAAVENVPAAR